MKKLIVAMAMAALATMAALAGSVSGPCSTVKVSDFGFDREDSTKFIQSALDSGAGRVVFDRRPEGPWVSNRLIVRSNKEIVFEDGAELVAKRGAFLGITDSLLNLFCVSNVTIRGGGTVRMWKADYVQPPYKKAEWRHALSVIASRDVTVEDLAIVESGGDGIYIASNDKPRPGFRNYCENVVVRNVKCLRNHRQGISVIAVDGLLVEGCELSDTCGTSPQAGIDFEPNRPCDTIANCVMRNCRLERNKGFGVDMLFTYHDETTAPLDITIENCISRDNAKAFHYNGIAQNGNLRTNSGRISVRNCVARERGGVDKPYSYSLEWGRPARFADGSAPRPMELEDWDYARTEVTDAKPGQMVPLMPARLRRNARYILYAADAGDVHFVAQQLPVGAPGRAKMSEAAMTLSDMKGEKVAEIQAPAATPTLCTARVPARGFYRLSWNCGWGSSLVLSESDAPIAISMLAERGIGGRWLAPFMYGRDSTTVYLAVPKGTAMFMAAGSGAAGGVGQSARTRVTDPAGKVVYDCDNMGYGDAYVSPANPTPGLWRIDVLKPSKAMFNNFGVDACGVPPLFFLSDSKYWTSKARPEGMD